jgi:hypothetical protein
MFGDLLAKWTRGSEKDGGKPQFRSAGDVQELLREDLAVVFKHSTACPVAPVYLVPVIKERPFSQRIAAETGVRHESPQVIVLRKGAVVATASHGDITADELGEMVGEKSRD